jgi:glyoxylase-like metal-dependent hydrolase (beta-lactamase superfamily II)
LIDGIGYIALWFVADHVSGAVLLKEKFGAPIGIGENITTVQKVMSTVFNLSDVPLDGSQFDVLWKDNQEFAVGNLTCRVLYTPGHTPACCSYYFVDDCVFVGDTVCEQSLSLSLSLSLDQSQHHVIVFLVVCLPDLTMCVL